MSWGVGHRRGSDLALLWLWHRPLATAPIRPLVWETTYVERAALISKKEKKNEDDEKLFFTSNEEENWSLTAA